MYDERLLVSGTLTLVAAALYLVTARRMAERDVGERWRGPWTGFLAWWYGTGALAALVGMSLVAAGLGHRGAEAFATVRIIEALVLTAALGGLSVHLVGLWGGNDRARLVAVATYSGFLVLLLNGQFAAGAVPVESVGWDLATAHAGSPALAWTVTVGIVAPPLATAATYAVFAVRHSRPAGRVRASTISLGMVGWGLAAGLITTPLLDSSDVAQFAFRLAGICATAAIATAHRPAALRRNVPSTRRGWEHVV